MAISSPVFTPIAGTGGSLGAGIDQAAERLLLQVERLSQPLLEGKFLQLRNTVWNLDKNSPQGQAIAAQLDLVSRYLEKRETLSAIEQYLPANDTIARDIKGRALLMLDTEPGSTLSSLLKNDIRNLAQLMPVYRHSAEKTLIAVFKTTVNHVIGALMTRSQREPAFSPTGIALQKRAATLNKALHLATPYFGRPDATVEGAGQLVGLLFKRLSLTA